MTKIIAALGALAMVAALAVAPQPASAQHMGMNHRCPRGSHWVPAHRNRQGRWVAGHCARR
ncbi:MAG TPA: hypothetical protein VHT53_04805 [Candidatus Elarobacter sp.]|jgi:hypothetical protein|nr:hypothetical protein [Candidatus Elarobacter sp.]